MALRTHPAIDRFYFGLRVWRRSGLRFGIAVGVLTELGVAVPERFVLSGPTLADQALQGFCDGRQSSEGKVPCLALNADALDRRSDELDDPCTAR